MIEELKKQQAALEEKIALFDKERPKAPAFPSLSKEAWEFDAKGGLKIKPPEQLNVADALAVSTMNEQSKLFKDASEEYGAARRKMRDELAIVTEQLRLWDAWSHTRLNALMFKVNGEIQNRRASEGLEGDEFLARMCSAIGSEVKRSVSEMSEEDLCKVLCLLEGFEEAEAFTSRLPTKDESDLYVKLAESPGGRDLIRAADVAINEVEPILSPSSSLNVGDRIRLICCFADGGDLEQAVSKVMGRDLAGEKRALEDKAAVEEPKPQPVEEPQPVESPQPQPQPQPQPVEEPDESVLELRVKLASEISTHPGFPDMLVEKGWRFRDWNAYAWIEYEVMAGILGMVYEPSIANSLFDRMTEEARHDEILTLQPGASFKPESQPVEESEQVFPVVEAQPVEAQPTEEEPEDPNAELREKLRDLIDDSPDFPSLLESKGWGFKNWDAYAWRDYVTMASILGVSFGPLEFELNALVKAEEAAAEDPQPVEESPAPVVEASSELEAEPPTEP